MQASGYSFLFLGNKDFGFVLRSRRASIGAPLGFILGSASLTAGVGCPCFRTGCLLNVRPDLVIPAGTVQKDQEGFGFGSFVLPIPKDPGLKNRKFYGHELRDSPVSKPAALLIASRPAIRVDLGPLGAPGCVLRARLQVVLPFVVTDPLGRWTSPEFPVPAAFAGAPYYNQVLILDSRANQLGLIVS